MSAYKRARVRALVYLEHMGMGMGMGMGIESMNREERLHVDKRDKQATWTTIGTTIATTHNVTAH